jgi:glycerol-3-phosphate dehydrogenase
MAEDVLARCFAGGLLPARAGGLSEHHTLVGATDASTPTTPLHQAPGPHIYGAQAPQVARCPGGARDLGLGLTEAMVRHAVRCEHAHTVEDVLARRWRALFLDARRAAAMAPAVAEILEDERCAAPALDRFEALCAHYLPPATHL